MLVLLLRYAVFLYDRWVAIKSTSISGGVVQHTQKEEPSAVHVSISANKPAIID